VEVVKTALPGIGLRHEFRTEKGQAAAVVSHVSGRRDLVIYKPQDPDSILVTLSLSPDEANGVAELLGTSRIVERLADLRKQVGTGLATVQVPIMVGSPYDGRTLADTQTRTRTGASIVGVVRAGGLIGSPRPDFVFHSGDIVVLVGTPDSTDAAAALFAQG
jgi:TrkA domain protein